MPETCPQCGVSPLSFYWPEALEDVPSTRRRTPPMVAMPIQAMATLPTATRPTSAHPSPSTWVSAITADTAITTIVAIMAGARSEVGQDMEAGTIVAVGAVDEAGTEQTQACNCPTSSSPGPSAGILLR